MSLHKRNTANLFALGLSGAESVYFAPALWLLWGPKVNFIALTFSSVRLRG
jgi:hypothetical protein